ncbi:MAG: hypothetical protein M0Q90_15425 [Bacteroidales bacterium]|nr:hypothetical protein [Bacteroidales bacterium]
MKSKKLYKQLLLLFLLIGLFTTCQKREYNNLWDENFNHDPETWAPSNLVLSVNDTSSITLKWEQSIVVEGFKLERKAADETWQTIAAFIDGKQRQYVDEAFELPAMYTYRIYAFAGKNTSSFTEVGLGQISVTTTEISNVTATNAISGGNITPDGGHIVVARGVVWSTSQNPTISNNQGITNDGTGIGSFTSTITNLEVGTIYYVRAYAINNTAIQYGEQISFSTTGTAVVAVTNPITGKIWMDRNLGAIQSAQSSADDQAYGDLYQWGRLTDGHEKRNSGTTSSLSSSDTPGHGNFIAIDGSPYDWRNPQNDNLWQGVNGTNNPCPAGYRLPTEAEWEDERQSWSSNSEAGTFTSALKLPVAGRSSSNGSLGSVGLYGYYWSATVDGTYARFLGFGYSYASMSSYGRAYGLSVRCLKD